MIRLLGNGYHGDDLFGEQATGLEWCSQRLAGTNVFKCLVDVHREQCRAGGVTTDGQRLQDRHAVGQHRAEDAAEAGDGNHLQRIASHGNLESPTFDRLLASLALENAPKKGDHPDDPGDENQPMVAQRFAHEKDDFGRQRLVHVGQHRLELGHEENQRANHDERAHQHKHGGIHEGAKYLASEIVEALEKNRQA